MNFESACGYLEKFVSYEQKADFLYNEKNFNLKRFKKFAEKIGVDYSKLKFAHVAGSKGKGTVSGFIAAYLKEAGKRVGLFTSPHILDVRERICVDGKMIPKKEFARYVEILKKNSEKKSWRAANITYFEMLTLIALMYFVDCECDYAVLEVGLGGRLDSTNIVIPEVSVLTRVELEHVGILGNNLSEILDEKLGIVKDNVPLIIGEQSAEAMKLLKNKLKMTAEAKQHDVEVFYVKKFADIPKFKSDDKAKIENGRTAFCALKVLLGKVENAFFMKVFNNLKLIGRFDFREIDGKNVVFDIAHTENSIKNLIEALKKKFPNKKYIFLVSLMKGKRVKEILKIISNEAERIVLTSSNEIRGYTGAELMAVVKENCEVDENCEQAYRNLLAKLQKDQVLIAAGSHFLIGKIIS